VRSDFREAAATALPIPSRVPAALAAPARYVRATTGWLAEVLASLRILSVADCSQEPVDHLLRDLTGGEHASDRGI
jgi:hypothetical protein